MRYVYLIQSESSAGQRYVGVTSDLRQRLAEHNVRIFPAAGNPTESCKQIRTKIT
jgi:predicted GIY-YIG superfamily endonuclease